MANQNIIFGVYCGSFENLNYACRLTESLRTFGGRFSQSPVWAFIHDGDNIEDIKMHNRLSSLDIELKVSRAPKESNWLYYAEKVYAAGMAELEAEDHCRILVWLDDDTVFLSEPKEFDLNPDISLAYCPVMHNRSGSLYGTPPDEFWGTIYELLGLTDDMLFPMTTPADKQRIRAYFHAGLLAVRPDKKFLRRWVSDFEILYKDEKLAEMCRNDQTRRIFLHQTALAGAVLNTVNRNEMIQLPEKYNYPIFFEKQYGGAVKFDSIEDAVTIRCLVSSDNMGKDWHRRLAGPADKVAWLKEKLNHPQ
jgi:hypothetical protein